MTLEKAKELRGAGGLRRFLQRQLGEAYPCGGNREHGQVTVDRLIRELERVFGFAPGTRFEGER